MITLRSALGRLIVTVLMVTGLMACTASYSQGIFKPLDTVQSRQLRINNGDFNYYWFMAKTSSLKGYQGSYVEKVKQLLNIRAKQSHICAGHYHILDSSIVLPEQGNVSAFLYCKPPVNPGGYLQQAVNHKHL